MHIFKGCFILLFSLLTNCFALAQTNVKVYSEETSDGFIVYADNSEYCPVTIEVNFDLKNVEIDTMHKTTFLIKENSKKTLLTTVKVIDKTKKSKFGYSYSSNLGNNLQTEYEEDFSYSLPFLKGNSFTLDQGYNGKFSHQNENSLDFKMPVGTPITAVREGVVVKIVQNNVLVCPKKECAKYNNFIIIYHNDGTFTEYTHLKKNGAKVKVGDKVTEGQIIACSGNTGWSSGPHLHLVIYLQRIKDRETLQTKFKTEDGTTSEILKENQTYSRNY